MIVILSIDAGYADCGWAVTSFHGQGRILVDAGLWTTTPDDGDDVKRIGIIEACFIRKLTELRPTGVGIEAYTHQQRTRQNARVAAGLVRLIDRMRRASEAAGIPVEEIPTSIAKMALGLRGKVPKKRVQNAVEALFGTRVGNHLADAVAVGVATRGRLLARGYGP